MVGVVRLEPGELDVGRHHVEQPARDASVQCADDRLVLADRIPVGAVRQADRDVLARPGLCPGLEAERGQRCLERIFAGRALA